MKKQDDKRKKDNIGRKQAWEECRRHSLESVSSANGWLKGGCVGLRGESNFFCPGILH